MMNNKKEILKDIDALFDDNDELLKWLCKSCEFLNPIKNVKCSVCSADKQEIDIKYDNDDQDDKDDSKKENFLIGIVM